MTLQVIDIIAKPTGLNYGNSTIAAPSIYAYGQLYLLDYNPLIRLNTTNLSEMLK